MEEANKGTRLIDNEGLRNTFIYRKQFERKLNPIYLFFTKAGLIYLFAGYYLYVALDGGFFTLILILAYGYNLYRNNFPYRYYQAKDIWLIKLFGDMIANRRKRTLQYNNLYPEFKLKNPVI